jgi:hypothetical protein
MRIRTIRSLLICVVAVFLIVCSCGRNPPESKQIADLGESGYVTVLLTNGQVFIGKLKGLGTAYPVLSDVHYVQITIDRETQKRSEKLVKRGGEWHAPNRTIFNANHIVLIEPVTKGSGAMEAINRLKTP